MRKVNTKNLTPENAWIEFVGTSEKMFLSNFRYEVPEMDIKKMCKIYAQELPIVFEYEGILFSDKQIEEIENLLVTHLANYIKKNGGIENLESLVEYLLKDCPGYLQLFPIEVIKAEAGKICKVA